MSAKSTPEIVLEFVKIFIWPLLVVIGVVWLGPDLRDILKSRTWKIGIIEVGDRVSNLEETLQNELLVQKGYLDKILAHPEDADRVTAVAKEAVAAIENAQEGVQKEVRNIRETIPERLAAEPAKDTPETATGEKPTTAKGWETLGFAYLLRKDVRAATEAFTKAEKIWPDYHNVSEIRSLLVQKQEALRQSDSSEWEDTYREILAQYSWGMPAEVRGQMQEAVGGD